MEQIKVEPTSSASFSSVISCKLRSEIDRLVPTPSPQTVTLREADA